MSEAPELLLSLPPAMQQELSGLAPQLAGRSFALHDPPDSQLGSGGGTAYLLRQAWRASNAADFAGWLRARRRIVLHGGGESRRLPAYAATGKLCLPLPALRWARGQRLGQTLLDLSEPFLREAFARSSATSRLMIASGDVMLRAPHGLPALPDADVVLLGMWGPPQVAQNYGVMFCDRDQQEQLLTFRQKPSPDEIRQRSRNAAFVIDVGVWLLSPRAVECLMTKCSFRGEQQDFAEGDVPPTYDLYGQWALHLGSHPELHDPEISELSVRVAVVRGGEFYHFGTTRDVIDSMYALQTLVSDPLELGAVPSLAQPRQFVQDSICGVVLRREENEWLWIENSSIPDTWTLASRHMLTGIPANDWRLRLPPGTCLDFVPLGESSFAIRPYGFSDGFRGPVAEPGTLWLGKPAVSWFERRGISWKDAGIAAACDLQRAPLFPVLDRQEITGALVQWMLTGEDDSSSAAHRATWLASQRCSARDLGHQANLARLDAQRRELRRRILPLMASHRSQSIFYKLDLADAAREFAASGARLPSAETAHDDLLLAVHNRMFRSEVLRLRGEPEWDEEQAASFHLLADAIVQPYQQTPTRPRFHLADDQIVWARSPVRVDLAGGWTDTPPYCLEHGGSVVNIALDLNGQPPIQVFARRSADPQLTIRSIDLGTSEVLSTYEEVGDYRKLGSEFAVAKAAFALAGFLPEFNGDRYPSLTEQLARLGGGIDISMLAAVPKGSGLGTSSILAGTVLAALADLCDLNWDRHEIAARTSAVEQMLGSGGGWQDQLGGLWPGVKLTETQRGLSQAPTIRWLPSAVFESPELESRSLLYYTGITRVAHDVLGEIVRGMFLNDPVRLDLLAAIGRNSHDCFDAIGRADIDAFAATIRRSWQLNCELDSGTNPPAVAELIERIDPHVSGLKLAGAGGGGFLYVVAKDEHHALALRQDLESSPPNERARFFDASLSATGLKITRS